MNARLDPVAAAPLLKKHWHSVSIAASSSVDPALGELVKIASPSGSAAGLTQQP